MVYNTITRRKEEFIPQEPPRVRMYVCGVTVYDYFHIGHARSTVVFDVIRRYLEYRGYKVKMVFNFTDVDDKLIRRSRELGIFMEELAEKYIDDYFESIDALGVKRATYYPRATEHINGIIQLVQDLIKKGYAYEVDGDVYFEVKKFSGYGKLSHRSLEEMIMGARVEVDKKKRDPMDFSLWKKSREGEPFWESPWSKGRPGWHVECSAMAIHYLGETLDIHGGGDDLIFPHHENEIAQSEGATGKFFAKYWLHNGMLQLKAEKMSKSTGNFITVREALHKYDPESIRFYLLSHHYRSPIDFSEENLQEAGKGLQRLYNTLDNGGYRLKKIPEIGPASALDKILPAEGALSEGMEKAIRKFEEAMDDDFNTALALSVLFDLGAEINCYLEKEITSPSGGEVLSRALAILRELGGVLGLFSRKKILIREGLPAELIDLILRIRQEARQSKYWELADKIREELVTLGIVLEDRPEGTTWRFSGH